MRLSSTDLALVDARASTLAERVSGEFVPTGKGASVATQRLERVKQLSARKETNLPALILYSSDHTEMSESQLLSVLGSVRRTSTSFAPQWTSDLNQIVDAVAGSCASEKSGQLSKSHAKDRSIPYEHLFWPIANFAWSRVAAEHFDASIRLDKAARHGLLESLVRRLSGILSGVLHPTFLAHKAFAASSMTQHFFARSATGSGESRTKQYANFVSEQSENGLASLFTDFPAAARLTAEIMRLWICFVGEFLERLRQDEREIARRFNSGFSLGSLKGVSAGFSDPHHGGKSVLILTFRRGLKLVYKPRPMGVDQLFYQLIRTINSRSPMTDLRILEIFDRGTHGWMEFAQSASCQNERAAKRYFWRAGALTCLTHWLRGIDFHRENVVAAGEHPLLLDLECLAHPLRGDELIVADAPSHLSLADSVLRTGLLPLWQTGKDSVRYNNCGFDAATAQRSLFASLRWKEINTDRMHWKNEEFFLRHQAHRAILHGRLLPIRSFERQVCAGYRDMACILEGADAIMYSEQRDGIYAQASRRIKRPTFLYALVLRRSMHPAYLADAVDRSIELLMLPCDQDAQEEWAAEIASLEKLDVPYFQYPALSKTPPVQMLNTPVSNSLHKELPTVSASVRGHAKLEAGKITFSSHRHGRNRPNRTFCPTWAAP